MTSNPVLKESIEILLQTGDYPMTHYLGNEKKAADLEAKNKEAKKTFENAWDKLYTNKTLTFANDKGETYKFTSLKPNWQNNSGHFYIRAKNATQTVFDLIETNKPVVLTQLNIVPEEQGQYFGLETQEYFKENNIQATPETKELLETLCSYRIK
jgi:hypothetical protein